MEWEFPEDFDFGEMPDEDIGQIEEWTEAWFDTGDYAFLDYVYDMLDAYDIEPEDYWGDVYGPGSE